MNKDFVERLRKAFGEATMADAARRLDLPHATVRNYYQGRLPSPEVLIKIAQETGISLNWLLLGRGEMYAGDTVPIDLGRFLEEKIGEMIDHRLSRIPSENAAKNDPQIAEFDVEAAVLELDDPQRVMAKWFRFEGRKYPRDYGVVFFRGWEVFSVNDKVAAVRDAKRMLDRAIKAE